MNQLLTVGQCVVTESSSSECTIEKFLGGGGQGEVYEAKVGGRLFALKWYFQASATAQQRNALEALVERGAPSDRFLWPVDLVSQNDVPGFGYLMQLRPPGYNRVVDLVKRESSLPSMPWQESGAISLTASFSFIRRGCATATFPPTMFFFIQTQVTYSSATTTTSCWMVRRVARCWEHLVSRHLRLREERPCRVLRLIFTPWHRCCSTYSTSTIP